MVKAMKKASVVTPAPNTLATTTSLIKPETRLMEVAIDMTRVADAI